MSNTLSVEQKKDYLSGKSGQCPKCKSLNIVGEHIEVDGQTAWQEVSCSNCEFIWNDIYTLTDIEVKV